MEDIVADILKVAKEIHSAKPLNHKRRIKHRMNTPAKKQRHPTPPPGHRHKDTRNPNRNEHKIDMKKRDHND